MRVPGRPREREEWEISSQGMAGPIDRRWTDSCLVLEGTKWVGAFNFTYLLFSIIKYGSPRLTNSTTQFKLFR